MIINTCNDVLQCNDHNRIVTRAFPFKWKKYVTVFKCLNSQGTQSRIGGVTFDILAQEAVERHQMTYWNKPMDMLVIRNPGVYHWRSGGEKHINDPDSIANLQVISI